MHELRAKKEGLRNEFQYAQKLPVCNYEDSFSNEYEAGILMQDHISWEKIINIIARRKIWSKIWIFESKIKTVRCVAKKSEDS